MRFVDSEYGYRIQGKIIADRIFVYCVATQEDDHAFDDFAGYTLVLDTEDWTTEIKANWSRGCKISRDLCRGMIPKVFGALENRGLEYRD